MQRQAHQRAELIVFLIRTERTKKTVRRNRILFDQAQNFISGDITKRIGAAQNFMKNQRRSKHVGSERRNLTAHVLWRHVAWGADISRVAVPWGTDISTHGKIHINQLELVSDTCRGLRNQHHIRRLQVTMNDIDFVQLHHRRGKDSGQSEPVVPSI